MKQVIWLILYFVEHNSTLNGGIGEIRIYRQRVESEWVFSLFLTSSCFGGKHGSS